MDASLLSIQPNAPEPLYRQITGQIRRLVAGGQLRAGQAIYRADWDNDGRVSRDCPAEAR